MNKGELIEKLAQTTGLSKADSGRAIDAFADIVKKSLRKKDPVTIVGFGTFDVVKRKARDGVNPKTKEKIRIKATTSPKFRPSKSFKDSIS